MSRMRLPALAAALALVGTAPPADDARALREATQDFIEAIAASAAIVQHDSHYAGDREQAAGTAYLTHMLLRTLESQLGQDADYPMFRVVDFRTREGGDNPDQRYLVAPLRGGARYRIWGTRGTSRRLEFQVYAGLPWSAAGGRTVAALDSDDLHAAADGHFELLLGPERQAGNWLPNPPDGSMVMVRQIFSDWNAEQPGEIHIDRIGKEGALRPPLTSAEMAVRLRRAAEDLRNTVALWPGFVRRQYEQRQAPNTLSPLFDPGALGGVPGRWMATAHFELADDEALLLTMPATGADYQSAQLTDLWFSSLEYANRVSSLTADQSYRSRDGLYHYVISAYDPGVQNWLDTTRLRSGVLLLRYDGLHGAALADAQQPSLRLVKRARLRAELPADTPAFDAAARARQIAERRRHVQRRFGI